ncbi:hypothetical protein XENTR_v10022970 [Xenopus tropicalis]|nr:hypothetical protein XENTR_v10022970 [Xenopus tropicalis]
MQGPSKSLKWPAVSPPQHTGNLEQPGPSTLQSGELRTVSAPQPPVPQRQKDFQTPSTSTTQTPSTLQQLAMRISEAVAPNKLTPGGILRKDVALMGDRLHINIRVSKTDAVGKGCIIWLGHFVDSLLCPVRNFQTFCNIRPESDGPFFMHRIGEYLSRFQFNKVFSMCLKKLGIPDKNYRSHSFRIGGHSGCSLGRK